MSKPMFTGEEIEEETRRLRTLENIKHVIIVISGKGGVGKSNVAINLAVQFRKMGKRVIILDADFGLANIEIMFGNINTLFQFKAPIQS